MVSSKQFLGVKLLFSGFYMFGNMDILQAASPLWRTIRDKLQLRNSIGKEILLQCDKHTENIFNVSIC